MPVKEEEWNINLILKFKKLNISLQNMNFMQSVVNIVIWLNLFFNTSTWSMILFIKIESFLFCGYFIVALEEWDDTNECKIQ